MADSSAPRVRSRFVGYPEPAWGTDRGEILARYLRLLAEDRSPLLQAGAATVEQLTSQLYSIVDTVREALDRRLAAGQVNPADGNPADVNPADVNPADEQGGASAEPDTKAAADRLGRMRAGTSVHLSHSMQAARAIFQAAMPTLQRRLENAGRSDLDSAAAVLLSEEILDRMSAAAGGYADHLLGQAHTSGRDERLRMSRELHDVAAPAVTVALQNLELFDLYSDSEPDRAAEKMRLVRQSMLDALATIRSLSARSRDGVGDTGLLGAIRRDLDVVPTDIRTSLTIEGDAESVSLCYADELFLIVREAIRNAAEHGDPDHIDVSVNVRGTDLTAEVVDDGRGFDLPSVLDAEDHVGLDSMSERAALIGAHLDVISRPCPAAARGTRVSVRVPLPVLDKSHSAELRFGGGW